MCGHVGILGTITADHEKAFRNMLVLDSLRGEHSTGIASIARHTDPLVVKAVGDPYVLFDTAGFNKALNRVNKALIGHNRYATSGSVTRNNAHPFQFDHIIGAHNGTLKNKYALENGSDFAVDSQALFNHIERNGVDDAIKKADGAWALVWWDGRDEKMHFLRNKERTLFGAFSEDEKSFMWASESWMLYVASSRNRIKLRDAFEIKEDTLFSISLPPVGTILPAFEEREVKSSPPPFTAPVVTAQRMVVHHRGGKGTDKAIAQIGHKQDTLSNKKGLSFRVIGMGRDSSGNLYAICDYPASPFQVRLYVKSQEEYEKLHGATIKADVGVLFSNPKSGFFYKIVYSSYVVEEAVQKAAETTEFLSKNGNEMEEEAWRYKYGTCCWCSGHVNPHLGYKFALGADEAVCHECMNDEEVKQYVY